MPVLRQSYAFRTLPCALLMAIAGFATSWPAAAHGRGEVAVEHDLGSGAKPRVARSHRHAHKRRHRHKHVHHRHRALQAAAQAGHVTSGATADHAHGSKAPDSQGKGTGHGHGEDVDTEHVFGFTEGSDVGEKGEKELESETSGRLGKRRGRYRAVDSGVVLKLSLTDDLRIAPGAAFSYHQTFKVPDLPDRNSADVDGLFLETRYRLLNRRKAPFGLTFSATGRFSRVDELTGERVGSYGSEFRLLADRELVEGKLFAAVNFAYGLATTHLYATNESENASGMEVSGAMAYQVLPGVFVGGEVRYARAYDGLGLDRLAGDAVFVGPTFFTKLTEHSFFSVAWGAQVAGREPLDRPGLAAGIADALTAGEDPNSAVPLRHSRLNLREFERHQIRVRLGYRF